MKHNLLPQYRVFRKKPKNLPILKGNLFEHEYSKEFGPINYFVFESVEVIKNGLIFQNNRLLPESLRHIRLRGILSLKSRFELKAKFLLKKIPKKVQKIEKGIWVTDNWSCGYFHWFADALPLIIKLREKCGDIPIIIPSDFLQLSFIKESLDLINIPYHSINSNDIFNLSILIISEPIANTGNYHPPTMCKIREMVLNKCNTEMNIDRIFISRKKSLRRNLLNENALVPILEKHNVCIICLEDIPWLEQIAYFKSCSVLIGQHGAGLTNMIYLQLNSKILEIRAKDDRSNNCYFSLSAIFDHDYYFSEAHVTPNPADHIGDMRVDAADFNNQLIHLCQ